MMRAIGVGMGIILAVALGMLMVLREPDPIIIVETEDAGVPHE